jgi:hypothetical protein
VTRVFQFRDSGFFEKETKKKENTQKWHNSLLLCRVGPGPGVRFPDGALHVHRPATDPTKAASSWNRPSPKCDTHTSKDKKDDSKNISKSEKIQRRRQNKEKTV